MWATGPTMRALRQRGDFNFEQRPFGATPAALAGVAAAMLPWAAQAQRWPSKPIRFGIPYPPGGASDVTARTLDAKLQDALGQPVVVELIADAKQQAGKLNFASAGIRAFNHLSGELFKSMAGVDRQHVAYTGHTPAMNDVVGGTVAVMFPTAIRSAPRSWAARPMNSPPI